MFYLNQTLQFPDPTHTVSEGLLALGGDLSTERLLLAYQSGIFPWFDQGDPIMWWSPDPRMVLFPVDLKISKSLRKTIQKKQFRVTHNQEFIEVINSCAKAKRGGQNGTWITKDMIDAYIQLHQLGHAKSIEVWQDNELVGGLYGIDLPCQKVFCGESMFSTVSNASKVGFVHLVHFLHNLDYLLIDCQVYTPHLESLGAQEISREAFLSYLKS